MASKKTTTNRTLNCLEKFQVKGSASGELVVEGWANKHVVDRGKDLMLTDAWDLDNFKKNPVILFNHDKDKPIGRSLDVRPTDGGLWIKAKISKSKDPEISRIRDLIEEGILSAFSVGFDAEDEQKNTEGVNEIRKAQLYEVSIVTLPMNQDSLFTISAKSLAGLSREEAILKVLQVKGALVAESVQGRIFEMLNDGGITRDELLAKIVDASGLDSDQVTQILAGNVTPVPEPVLGAFADILGLDADDLRNLDKRDQDIAGAADSGDAGSPAGQPNGADNNTTDTTQEGKDAANTACQECRSKFVKESVTAGKSEEQAIAYAAEQCKDACAEKPNAAEAGKTADGKDQASEGDKVPDEKSAAGTKDMIGVMSLQIPKSVADTRDAAQKIAADCGYSPVGVDEQGDVWNVVLEDQANFDGEPTEMDIGDGVIALVGVRKKPEGQTTTTDVTTETPKDMTEDPAKPNCDTGTQKQKQTGENGGTAISGGGDGTIVNDENPQLAQSKQTNVLLGVLIQEIRELKAAMTVAEAAEEDTTGGVGTQVETEGLSKEAEKSILENLTRYIEAMEVRIKRLGA